VDLDGGTRAAAALSARERLDELEPRAHLLQPAHLDLELRRTQRRGGKSLPKCRPRDREWATLTARRRDLRCSGHSAYESARPTPDVAHDNRHAQACLFVCLFVCLSVFCCCLVSRAACLLRGCLWNVNQLRLLSRATQNRKRSGRSNPARTDDKRRATTLCY